MTPEREKDRFSLIIQSLTWLLLIFSIFAYLARILTKLTVKKTGLEADDYLITVSLILSVGQSAATNLAASHGLGRASNLIDSHNIDSIQQYQFAGTLLWLLSMCFGRLAYLSLVQAMTPIRSHRKRIRSGFTLIIAWSLTSFLVSAFQCSPPRTWDYMHGSCISRPAWFMIIDIIDAIVDAILIALPTFFILSLQAGKKAKKFEAISFFWIRFVVISASICNAVFWSRMFSSPDPIQDIWPVAVCTQVLQATNIVSISALYLKPFVKMLQSGFLRIDDEHRRGSTRDTLYSQDSRIVSFFRRVKGRPNSNDLGISLGTINQISAAGGETGIRHERDLSVGSNVIHTETTWTVESRPREEFKRETPPRQEHAVEHLLRPDL